MAIGQLGAALRHLRRAFESGSASGLSDTELVDRFVDSRDGSAFAAIVARHGPMVLATARGILRSADDAEDAFQATFLVLARKAGTLWVGESLGGWLHRVARRIAVQASLDSTRRRKRERPIPGLDPAEPANNGPWDDWLPVLHEEIGKLPEKYRVPIVLCDLEALTRDEAAGQLGWPPGTVAGRLARGRKLLHDRMARRGVTAGPLAMAVVPQACLRATIQAATRVEAGAGVGANLASSTAVLWSERLLRTMLVTKFKFAGALVGFAVVAGLSVAGWVARTEGQAPAPKAPEVAKPQATTAEPPLVAIPIKSGRQEFEDQVISGIVVGPDARPVGGARVYWLGRGIDGQIHAEPRATTGADGRFRITVKVTKQPDTVKLADGQTVTVMKNLDVQGLVASADGYGLGLPGPSTADGTVVNLVRDQPMTARVLDIQGRPVAGARVRGLALLEHDPTSMDLSGWLEALKSARDMNEKSRAGALLQVVPLGRDDVFAAIHEPAATDAEGRFHINGIGKDRVLMSVIEGPGIESRIVYLANRPGVNLRVDPYTAASRAMYGDNADEDSLILGIGSDHVAGPGRTVEGVVKDREGRGLLPGFKVRAERRSFLDSSYTRRDSYFATTTDGAGHYRLEGFPEGQIAKLSALPMGDIPYPGISTTINAGRGQGTAMLDFPLQRGVWVSGRVFDRATGQAKAARVELWPFVSNPNVPKLPSRPIVNDYMTAGDGRFKLAAFPGPGLLTASGTYNYVRGFGFEKIKDPKENGMLITHPYLLHPQNATTIVRIDPPVGDESIAVDLALETGHDRLIKAVGPDGRPATGLKVNGSVEMSGSSTEGSEFTVSGLVEGHRRQVVVRQDDRKWMGVLEITEPEGPPLTVTLQPWAGVTGRLVDEEGKPRQGTFTLQWKGDGMPFALGSVLHEPHKFRIAPDGRFRVDAMMPGIPYELGPDYHTAPKGGWLARDLVLKPGEARDLGDVQLIPRP